jgi:micrococcal nuclease
MVFGMVFTGVLSQGCSMPNLAPKKPESTTATVTKVVDGDTVKLQFNDQIKTVRLIGIDTPESVRPGVSKECGSQEASDFLKRTVKPGTKVIFRSDQGSDREDKYGRLLGYVDFDHRSIQSRMLESGYANVYIFQGNKFERLDAFEKNEAQAKDANRGVWGLCDGDFHRSL